MDSIKKSSVSLADLPSFTKEIADFIRPGDWIFLEGDLGSGKTTFTKFLAQHFGCKDITSPTFSIMNAIPLEEKIFKETGIKKLLHLDLYRIKKAEELYFIGLEEEFLVKNSVALIEWPSLLEEQEWQEFFTMTRCQKPKRILLIQVSIPAEGCDGAMRDFDIQTKRF